MPKMKQRRSDISKIVFIISAILLLIIGGFSFGLYSGAKKNTVFHAVKGVWDDALLVFAESQNIVPSGMPIHFVQPSRKPGSGVIVNERSDRGLILLSGFFDGGNELRLIRRDGHLVMRWPVRFSEHFPDTAHLVEPPATDRNVDTHGALIRADGSVVFNYDYGGTVKLSRCGEILWTLAHPTHHSIEVAEAGGYWIPGRNYLDDPESFPPFTRQAVDGPHIEDLILKVSEEGEIVERKSVPRILYDNGLEPLMTATGETFGADGTDRELLHLNKIGELSPAFAGAYPGFEAGDLVLSLRNYNLLLVVDPDTWRVKWHRTGPWRRQHDPEFSADGTITVFNNNAYHLELREYGRSNPDTPRVSEIVRADPASGETAVVYGDGAGQEFLSVIRGKHQPTPDGGFLITEFEAGRAFEVDAGGRLVWEYINRYDEEWVLEVTEARLYPKGYFTVKDWSCPARTASD